MSQPVGYNACFSGRLSGLLQWDQFEALWSSLAQSPDGWYVRDFKSAALPDAPMPGDAFKNWLAETEKFLRKRHREEYCGFLYVNDRDAPVFIKVFDPRKMGSSCGCSGHIMPRWTISRMPPERTIDEMAEEVRKEAAKQSPSLLRRLFGRA